jgi:hypothetical protein
LRTAACGSCSILRLEISEFCIATLVNISDSKFHSFLTVYYHMSIVTKTIESKSIDIIWDVISKIVAVVAFQQSEGLAD